jgi:putative endonuclease
MNNLMAHVPIAYHPKTATSPGNGTAKNNLNTETITTRDIGICGEDFVCQRLIKNGFKILARNVYSRSAEIDIVAEQDDTLCFIEVRTRKTATFGHPAETIDNKKKNSVRRAAEAYLMRLGMNAQQRPIRFDVATIVWDKMEFMYFENAF